jgi:segregation and condensation protein B
MEIEQIKSIIESILFAAGRDVKITEFMSVLELGKDEIMPIIENLINEYKAKDRGIEIIKVNDGFQMCTKKENYEYLYQIFDKRSKPNLSNAALETLSIIAYNPKITRAEIESIRGVNSDGTIYKLMEYGLIESAGKLDLPGRPTAYRTTDNFLKTFGFTSLEELPELPKYKLDENQQIVIDDLIETEAPSPSEETEEQENNIESEGE